MCIILSALSENTAQLPILDGRTFSAFARQRDVMTTEKMKAVPGVPGGQDRKIDYTKKLPDAEYEVMQAIWGGEPPLNTAYLMEKVGRGRGWKAPTLISFLVRLEDRGYITSYKQGKERYYLPLADREQYLRTVTEQFIQQYHDGSFVRMMDALYKEKKLSEADIDELLQWLKTKY